MFVVICIAVVIICMVIMVIAIVLVIDIITMVIHEVFVVISVWHCFPSMCLMLHSLSTVLWLAATCFPPTHMLITPGICNLFIITNCNAEQHMWK